MTQASWSPQMGLMVMNEIKSCKIPHLARSVLWEILDLRVSPRLHPDFPRKPTPPLTVEPNFPSAQHTEIYRAL